MYIVNVEVRKSAIDGNGVFALENIPEHTRVWVFRDDHDHRISEEEYQKLSSEQKDHLSHVAYLSPWSGKWVYPPEGDPAEYTNHSARNNLSVQFDNKVSEEPFFIANRDIAAGEELTNNYHEFDEITRTQRPDWAANNLD